MTRRVGWLALLPAGLALGSGPLNGDVAAYLVSPVTERWVHVPYAALARLVGPVGLDLASLFAAVVMVALVGRRSAVAAVAAAAVLLPWAPFGEVDLPWVACAVAAVTVHPAWLGLGVLLSPTALLAAPWVAARTRRWEGPVAAILAVAALTIASGGAWWTGERGVLHAGPLLVGRGLGAWLVHLPWLLVWARPESARRLPWLLPMALAPTDTPLWLLPALEVAMESGGRWGREAAAVHWVAALGALGLRAAQVTGETALVAEVAREWGPESGLVAPWTWGARVAVAVSGDPYGARWHPPGRWLRGQRAAWCARPPLRVDALPPGDPAVEAECPPDVVLVIGCTVRRDHLDSMPFVTGLAREGLQVEDLIAAAPWTRAAGVALLTGRHALDVGMVEPGPEPDARVLGPVRTLAEHLRAEGYTTLGVTANPNLGPTFGFDRGFDRFESLSPDWSEGGRKVAGAKVVDAALGLLDEAPGSMFLEVVLVDAHAPYPDGDYRAGLRQLDEAVAALDAGLKARGRGDAWLVFASDHGEGLSIPPDGEGHGRTLGPGVVEAVLIARGPGRGVIGGTWSQVDVPGTLVHWLGLAPFGTHMGGAPRPVFTDTWFREADRAAIYAPDRWCERDFATGAAGCSARPSGAPITDAALLERVEAWRAR